MKIKAEQAPLATEIEADFNTVPEADSGHIN